MVARMQGFRDKVYPPSSLSPFPMALSASQSREGAVVSHHDGAPSQQKSGKNPLKSSSLDVDPAESTAIQIYVDKPRSRTSTKKTKRKRRRSSITTLDANALPARLPQSTSEDHERARRSDRQRFRPLEFWKGERVVYGHTEGTTFENIVDVIIPDLM